MGTRLVIVLPPHFDFALRILQRQEPVRVQTLGTEAPVERFDLGVIGRLAWMRKVELDPVLAHRSGRITTHYSAAEFANLIVAANRVCESSARKMPTLVMLKQKAPAAVAASA